MIGHEINGIPRPAGSVFRQRVLYVANDGRCERWIASVVDTKGGVAVEAISGSLRRPAVTATDLTSHKILSVVPPVLVEVLRALDDDGWTARTVPECHRRGCDRPVPMWATPDMQGRGHECLACETRTVLACVECGLPDPARCDHRERLLDTQTCMVCDLWLRRLDKGPEVVTDNWRMFTIGTGTGPAAFRGFGGHRFVIEFNDGRRVETGDLWTGGEIPEWFRDRFVPNATVRSADGEESFPWL